MKLTNEQIEALVVSEEYHLFQDTTITVCCLKLLGMNGYTLGVTGESACIDPSNFSEEKGRIEARKKAIDKLWELEGYSIKKLIIASKVNQQTIPEDILRIRQNLKEGLSLNSPQYPSWFNPNDQNMFIGVYNPTIDLISSSHHGLNGEKWNDFSNFIFKIGSFFIIEKSGVAIAPTLKDVKFNQDDMLAWDGAVWQHWNKPGATFKTARTPF